MNSFRSKTIKSVTINGIRLDVEKVWNGSVLNAWYEFSETDIYVDDDFSEVVECVGIYHGLKMMEERVAELQDTPNWNMQRAYDQAHGTINGQDPAIQEMWS